MASKAQNGAQEAPKMKARSQAPTSSTLNKARPAAHDSAPARMAGRAAAPKPPVERRAPRAASAKSSAAPEKQPPQEQQLAELLSQLAAAKEELSKAAERLASAEKEKADVAGELEVARRAAEEANRKQQEALAARSKAEELIAVEKSRVVELEQSAAEVRSLSDELDRAKRELAEATDAKNSAVSRADEAAKAAEVSARNVELLNAEVCRLKALVDAELEKNAKEAAETLKKVEAEAEALRHELEKKREVEEKTVVLQNMIKVLRADIVAVKKAEFDANVKAGEWKQKAEALEVGIEDAARAAQSTAESLAAAVSDLDAKCALLRDREAETVSLKSTITTMVEENALLKNTVTTMEAELAAGKKELDESGHRLGAAQSEIFDMRLEIEALKSKLDIVGEEKMEAVEGESNARMQVEILLEEKNKLVNELEASNAEAERLKKAMDDLGSALSEASAEARDTQERFLAKQAAAESAVAQIAEMKSVLENTQESYELMLDEVKYERVCLQKSIERLESEAKNSADEWRARELEYAETIKRLEAEMLEIKQGELKRNYGPGDTELQAEISEANGAIEETETKETKTEPVDAETELQVQDEASSERDIPNGEVLVSPESPAGTEEQFKDEHLDEGNGNCDADECEPVVAAAATAAATANTEDDDATKEKENDTESSDLGSHTDDNSVDPKAHASAEQKKKPLLRKFGGLLKKKNHHLVN